MPSTLTRAAIYCRISADRDGRAVGVRTQERDCREIAERRGWEVVEVFADNSKTAWKRNRKRPGWDRLMEGLTSKSYDALIVYHGDRLIRQPRDLEDLLDVADRGVQLASPSGQRDLSDPDDRFILRIEVAHACRSSDDTSRRTQRAHLRLAEEGRDVGGGSRPFGFDEDRHTVRVDEAELIREAARRLLAGDTLRGLSADWTMRSVSSVSGAPWKTSVISRMVTSGRVCGWREHKGRLVAEATWPAILDRTTVERLRVLLRDPTRRTNARAVRYLLSGLVYCERCKAKMVARPRDDHVRRYVCATGPNFVGCGKTYILAEPLETLAVDLAARRVKDLVAVEEHDDESVVAEIEACDGKLAELAQDWAADRLSRHEWMAARDGVERRRADAVTRLSIRDEVRMPTDWDKAPFDEKRAALTGLVDRVVILPGRRGFNQFDEDRAVFTWRL